jgi:hypothetical protein
MKKNAYGLNVDVQHEVSTTKNGLTVIKITATCGETSHDHSITVGAVDGNRPAPPTATELQLMLDNARDDASQQAGWKESVRSASASLV